MPDLDTVQNGDSSNNSSDERARVRNSALASLTRREHSRAELADKLARRCDNPAVIDETLDWLTSLNYLNDERYAEAFIRSALLKGRGPLRIKRELQQKGVAGPIINHAFDVAEIDWWQQAHELWQRKFGSPPVDAKARGKQIRFMLYRGFSLDVVNDIINGADRFDD